MLQVPVVQAVNIELIDLGTHPLRLGGVKAYETVAEEGMLEVPVQWGSNARVRVSVTLGVAGYGVSIPIEVRDVQVVLQQAVLHQRSFMMWVTELFHRQCVIPMHFSHLSIVCITTALTCNTTQLSVSDIGA